MHAVKFLEKGILCIKILEKGRFMGSGKRAFYAVKF